MNTTEAADCAQFFVFRALTEDDKKRDLMRLISWGKSRLDPPPSVGATKAPAPKLADADGIRPQNPEVDRGDAAALRIVADIDPDERAAKIRHLREHGSCSSWALPGPMARRQAVAVATRVVAKARRPAVVLQDDWFITTPVWARALSDSRKPNGRGPRFWSSGKEAKPLPGSHRVMTDPWTDLVAKAKRSLLRPQDERQKWVEFLNTGDEDVRQRLISGCETKCLFHARKMLEQERWDAFMMLRDEVGRIIDKRDFDPDKASLPTWVEKILALRVRDIKKSNRTRAKLFGQIDHRAPAEYDDDGALAEAEMAEAVVEVDQLAARLDYLLASTTDETDWEIIRLYREGRTESEIAVELRKSQATISRRIKKMGERA